MKTSFSEKTEIFADLYFNFQQENEIPKALVFREIKNFISNVFNQSSFEGMVNYYLCAFGNRQKMTGRLNVSNQWYEFGVQISNDIWQFLKFFSINLPVVVDNFEFAPSKDFVPLINLENEK